jgi:hypothetical protein
MDGMGKELNIHHILTRMLRSWWLMVGLGLVGALVGFLFSLIHPPVFEAKAVLGVNIIYGVTEPLALVVEDRALSRVATLVLADTTMEDLLDEIPGEVRNARGWENPADLQKTVRLERRLAEWDLVVADHDPEVAAQVAQKWADVTLGAFNEAVDHAWRAVSLMRGGSFTIDCEEEIENNQFTRIWQCAAYPLNTGAEDLDEELQMEIRLSRGVLPNLSYELLRRAIPSEEPVLWRRSWLLLAGAIAGIAIGCLLTLLNWDHDKHEERKLGEER